MHEYKTWTSGRPMCCQLAWYSLWKSLYQFKCVAALSSPKLLETMFWRVKITVIYKAMQGAPNWSVHNTEILSNLIFPPTSIHSSLSAYSLNICCIYISWLLYGVHAELSEIEPQAKIRHLALDIFSSNVVMIIVVGCNKNDIISCLGYTELKCCNDHCCWM